jgi:hypothetical protein
MKIVIVLALAHILSSADLSTTYFVKYSPSPYKFLLYFYSWDSGWYTKIAESGYTAQMLSGFCSNAFLPLYPGLMRAVGYVFRDPLLAGFLISNALGILWVPLFLNVAEQYMDGREAFCSTLLTAAFPYVLIFTSVVYSESLLLFSTLLAWVLYRKNMVELSSVAAAAAALTKIYGVFILIPIVADIVKRRAWKKLTICMLPILSFASWFFYVNAITGTFFGFMDLKSYSWNAGRDTIWWTISPILKGDVALFHQRSGYWHISIATDNWAPFPYLILTVLALFGLGVFLTWQLDWRLAAYSSSLFFAFIYLAPAASLIRYLAFVFPIWLILRVRNYVTLILTVGLFSLLSLALWYEFILGWIG